MYTEDTLTIVVLLQYGPKLDKFTDKILGKDVSPIVYSHNNAIR